MSSYEREPGFGLVVANHRRANVAYGSTRSALRRSTWGARAGPHAERRGDSLKTESGRNVSRRWSFKNQSVTAVNPVLRAGWRHALAVISASVSTVAMSVSEKMVRCDASDHAHESSVATAVPTVTLLRYPTSPRLDRRQRRGGCRLLLIVGVRRLAVVTRSEDPTSRDVGARVRHRGIPDGDSDQGQ